MSWQNKVLGRRLGLFLGVFLILALSKTALFAGDLSEVLQRGSLRHLGIPYAHFVTPNGEGLDVELMQLFAKHLGVRYELITTSWSEGLGDLTGQNVKPSGDDVTIVGSSEVRGDLLANGLTILPWRQKIIDYSVPTFPTGVWLVARADSQLKPIIPSGDMAIDIEQVRSQLKGHSILTMKGTCLDPNLYDLSSSKAEVLYYTASENLGEMAPAVINGMADATLLDIPDALIALQTWPGDIKVIGPVSPPQLMGVGFAKTSPKLREAFDAFFMECRENGSYERLVRKYYPTVFLYLGDFFSSR